MFFHVFRYGVKSLLRAKEIIFWNLIFPFALATFMFLAFSDIFDATEKFEVIPVAVVKEQENQVIEQVFAGISEPGNNQLIQITETNEKEAKKLLKEEKVTGIIYVNEKSRLMVRESGIHETMLQAVLEQISQSSETILNIVQKHPENLQKVIEGMRQEVTYSVSKNNGTGNQDNVVNYFYAIFAMTCLFASFASCDRSCKIQADVCALGQRRGVTPVPKLMIILTEFLVCELMQFLISCLLFVYLRYVLQIQVGDNVGAILVLLLLASSLGTMLGIFVGSLPKVKEEMKIGILVSVTLFLCMLSDLMAQGIRDLIEHYIPIVNDINPAALICDSFYALNVYEGYGRFAGNMVLLVVITVVLTILSYVIVRRNKYASL